jgi:hypothetical protein
MGMLQRMRSHFSALIAVLFIPGLAVCVTAQEIRISNNVSASPKGGWYPLYEMHIDPDNTDNMILCGARFEPMDNAFYGFVNSSTDGGKTWQIAFEDKSSTFESEHSCAFGSHGVAYYVASASKVIDGEPHHDQGTTRIYVSRDAGKNWKLGTTTGWTDWSTSVVDTAPGPNQNRLYVFFNNLQTFYGSLGENDLVAQEAKTSDGTRVGMISFKEGDAAVAGPFSSDAMDKEKYHGSYPAPGFVLKDGSVLTFYTTKRRTEQNKRQLLVESVRTNSNRTGLEAPVTIVDSLNNSTQTSDVACGGVFLSSGAAYAAQHDKLYFVYPDVSGKTCDLFLTTSSDEGETWSKARQLWSPEQSATHEYISPELAVNKDGFVSVLWQDEDRSGCWRMAALTDNDTALSHAVGLGTCSATDSKPSALNTAYLWTSLFQADPTKAASTIRINLRNTHNSVWRNAAAITATPDGAFHAVWIDSGGDGAGEIRTASSQVIPASTLVAAATHGLENVTDKVTVLFAGAETYDAASGTITLDIAIRNNRAEPIRGPIRLVVPTLYKDYGFAEIGNSVNHVPGAGAEWDLDSSTPDEQLAAGATSKPITLRFHYILPPNKPHGSDDILGLNVQVFASRRNAQAASESLRRAPVPSQASTPMQ